MQKFLKPASPDLVLRDHQDGFARIPAEGKIVNYDFTFARRVQDGSASVHDVVDGKPVFPEAKPQLAPKPAVTKEVKK
jgi:hypothetical protein